MQDRDGGFQPKRYSRRVVLGFLATSPAAILAACGGSSAEGGAGNSGKSVAVVNIEPTATATAVPLSPEMQILTKTECPTIDAVKTKVDGAMQLISGKVSANDVDALTAKGQFYDLIKPSDSSTVLNPDTELGRNNRLGRLGSSFKGFGGLYKRFGETSSLEAGASLRNLAICDMDAWIGKGYMNQNNKESVLKVYFPLTSFVPSN